MASIIPVIFALATSALPQSAAKPAATVNGGVITEGQVNAVIGFEAARLQVTRQQVIEPLRTDVASAGYPARGPATAPVTIVEFSDFECPFCGGLFPTLKALENLYLNQVRIVYRQFPLRKIHPLAEKAAEASLCAGEQGRFWEMHDSLFGDQEHLTIDALKARAVQLNLNTAAFNACVDSGKEVAAIDKDIADGARAGVTGTPVMFINGRMMLGNQPFAQIQAIIQDELQRKKK